jgi:transposase
MWKTLGGFWAQMGPFAHILPPKTAHIHCGAVDLALFRRPYVSIEERIPASHPLRRIRKVADQALDRLNPTFFAQYAAEGRPSVPPEQLLLASLLQAFYGIRSERLLLEQLH